MKARVFFVLLLTVATISPAPAAIRHVPDQYGTIQAAIQDAAQADTVLVAPGTYGAIDFLGKYIVVTSQYLLTQNQSAIRETIIDANQEGHAVTFQGGEIRHSQLIGFTIRNGRAFDGGGVYCRTSSPTLAHLIITENRALEDGAGIACFENSSPTLNFIELHHNTADEHGGGLYGRDNCDPYLTNVFVHDNTASSGAGMYFHTSCEPYLEDVRVFDNAAQSLGGGIACVSECELTAVRTAVAGNSSQSLYAGGIYCGISEITLINATVTDNSTAGSGGGGLYLAGRFGAIITNSIFWNNEPDEINCRGTVNPPAPVDVDYSDLAGGREGVVIAGNSRLTWGQGNLDQSPLFVSAQSRDYHLTSDSPCRDTGDPDSDQDPDETRADQGAFFFDSRVEVPTEDLQGPSNFGFIAAYPNPFNASVTLSYQIERSGFISLAVYNALGQQLEQIRDSFQPAGRHQVVYAPRSLTSGNYFAILKSNSQQDLIRLTYVK